jgi:glycosyltransferase involved in cell wall biosynthesis
MITLKSYTTPNGLGLLYSGNPNFSMLDELAEGPGDLWHSSLDQGFKNCFQDIIYQTAIYWWFVNDFDESDSCVNWRVNANNFVVRASAWEEMNGFDTQYSTDIMSGLDFGFNMLRNCSGTPLFIKNLYPKDNLSVTISAPDRYLFYLKNFKKHHSYYMMFRKGVFQIRKEFKAFSKSKKNIVNKSYGNISVRSLHEIKGKPTVSLVIPTMKRQEYTQLLLNDHKNQTYQITEAVIVDATPKEERDNKYYRQEDFNFTVKVKWQTTKGSCRARNEAMELCSGDYIIFADDDIRIQPSFVENHIKLLQTYNAAACNGLDIMAENVNQNLNDLKSRLASLGKGRWRVGVSPMFSNANSCVRRDYITKLIGNDINFDGGYGEDADFGLSIIKKGGVLLHNPFSANLHLKPPVGGYRWWGSEAKKKGSSRKKQPWELDNPVKNIRPVPSPTITYGILKHFTEKQVKEWRFKHFFMYLFKGNKKGVLRRFLKLPYKQIQFSKSLEYAKALINLGVRYK